MYIWIIFGCSWKTLFHMFVMGTISANVTPNFHCSQVACVNQRQIAGPWRQVNFLRKTPVTKTVGVHFFPPFFYGLHDSTPLDITYFRKTTFQLCWYVIIWKYACIHRQGYFCLTWKSSVNKAPLIGHLPVSWIEHCDCLSNQSILTPSPVPPNIS